MYSSTIAKLIVKYLDTTSQSNKLLKFMNILMAHGAPGSPVKLKALKEQVLNYKQLLI